MTIRLERVNPVDSTRVRGRVLTKSEVCTRPLYYNRLLSGPFRQWSFPKDPLKQRTRQPKSGTYMVRMILVPSSIVSSSNCPTLTVSSLYLLWTQKLLKQIGFLIGWNLVGVKSWRMIHWIMLGLTNSLKFNPKENGHQVSYDCYLLGCTDSWNNTRSLTLPVKGT